MKEAVKKIALPSAWSFVLLLGLIITQGASARVILEGPNPINVDYLIDADPVLVQIDTNSPEGTEVTIAPTGVIAGELVVWQDSIVEINGGSIGTGGSSCPAGEGAVFRQQSQGTFNSGQIVGAIGAGDDAEIYIHGGTIGAGIYSGLPGGGSDSATIFIYGSSFNYPLGQLSTHSVSGFLTGTLENGDPISNQFYIYDNSEIILVPEPATICLLCAGGVLLHKGRRNKGGRLFSKQ